MSTRFDRFPVDPRRSRVFYGWIVLAGGTMGVVFSAPGQTVGVSVFTDYLIDALDLERSALSLAYLFGTLGSAVVLSWAGRLYDRVGARLLATAAAFALTLVLFALSASPILVRWFDRTFYVAAALTVLFFLLRFTGQGMVSLASRNMVMEWFNRRRGFANAIMGISLSFGFSLAPRLFDSGIERWGWQGAWRVIGLALAIFGTAALLFFRDKPEPFGLEPDGPLATSGGRTHPESHPGRDFTAAEARRTRAFWAFSVTVLLAGLLITAYTFHIVSIFADAGLGRARAIAVFFPAAIVSVAVELVGSWISDFVRLKWLALFQLSGTICLALGIVFLRPGPIVLLLILGHGLMQGMFGILNNITWPRFFGRRHLGAISGLAAAITVSGTAVGPYLFSGLRDLSGTYATAALVIAGAAIATAAVVAGTERPT